MNYKIITDEKALIEFIKWLPELKENEQYYLSLFARKKYCPSLIKSNDKTQLKRFTSTKERMLDKIKGLERQVGRWKLKDIEAPQESLVLYIHPNPRNMKKATEMMGKKCWDLIRSNNFNLHAEAMSCIQKSKSRSCFVHFDIDTDEKLDITLIEKIFPPFKHYLTKKIFKCFSWVQTRGGYHLLIDPHFVKSYNEKHSTLDINLHLDKVPKDWHKEVVKLYPIEQSGDLMLPVPGTYQGGFTPKFI